MEKVLGKRGLVGWLVIIASLFVWIVVIGLWYKPEDVLNLSDRSNILIALWWTIVCGVCVFVGLRIEKNRTSG